MKPQQTRTCLIAALLLACAVATWYFLSQFSSESAGRMAEDAPGNTAGENAKATVNDLFKAKLKTMRQDPDFPINDKTELPFLGKIQCHSREEKVQFTGGDKPKEWPFKVYYLPNGMFFRAEYVKPGANIAEFTPEELTVQYKGWCESIVGFPEEAAPASLAKVLQNLYAGEAFDRATKISIYWVLRADEANNKLAPCFIANIYGVSSGVMSNRVPESDELFLRYRIILNPQGEGLFSDNLL